MGFSLGIKKLIVGTKNVADQATTTYQYAKSVKEGNTTKKVSGDILKSQSTKKLKKLFK